MLIGVPRETAPGEHRVSLTPDTVGRLAKGGLQVIVESGAGVPAALPDADYTAAGARVADAAAVYAEADVVVRVGRLEVADVAPLRSGQVLVGFVWPLQNGELVSALAAAGVTAFGMESVPRITRAQSMDALSSQATVSGYKAVLWPPTGCPSSSPCS